MFAIASFNIFTYFFLPIVCHVNVNIDGILDLGPKWSYEYKLESVKSIPLTTNFHADVPHHKINRTRSKLKRHHKALDNIQLNEASEVQVTKQYMANKFWPKSLFFKPRAVKEDKKIHDFVFHVYKQSMKVFEELKKKITPEISHRVDALTNIFDEKFREFVNETMDHKIKTKLGPQRVILNTVDTSNRLLRRLVNYFIGDLKKDGFLRKNDIAINVFQKEVERQCHLEMFHICNKFGICSSANGFSEFLTNFLTTILKNDNTKIKIVADAFSEVVKNTDFSKIMSNNTQKLYKRQLNKFEKWDRETAKSFFWIAKNVIALKNQPLRVMVGGNAVNKTVAFLEVIDILDKTLPANEENKLEWSDLENSLTDWSDGKRNDILEVMQGFVSYIKKKGIDSLESAAAKNVDEKMFIIFS